MTSSCLPASSEGDPKKYENGSDQKWTVEQRSGCREGCRARVGGERNVVNRVQPSWGSERVCTGPI
jgi:hypothetical protein